MLRFLFIAFITITSFHANAAEFTTHSLSFNQEPLNPACVDLTSTSLADNGIIVRSVNIDNCQNSNQAFAGKDGFIENGYLCYRQQQTFCYKVIAKVKSNHFVVQTYNFADDGSGVFTDWRLYRLEQINDVNGYLNNKGVGANPLSKQHTILTLLANVATGGIGPNKEMISIKVEDNKVIAVAANTETVTTWDLKFLTAMVK